MLRPYIALLFAALKLNLSVPPPSLALPKSEPAALVNAPLAVLVCVPPCTTLIMLPVIFGRPGFIIIGVSPPLWTERKIKK